MYSTVFLVDRIMFYSWNCYGSDANIGLEVVVRNFVFTSSVLYFDEFCKYFMCLSFYSRVDD